MANKRTKKSKDAQKRGPKGHFQGYKLQFLLNRSEAFQNASDSRTTGYFYNTITRDFIARYGESKPWNSLDADEPPDPVDVDFDQDLPTPSEEEAALSIELFDGLRSV